MKPVKSQILPLILAGLFFSWGVVLPRQAACQESHPDYQNRLLELLGKQAYKLDLPNKTTLSIIGSPEEIKSGNYYTGSQLVYSKDPSLNLYYLAKHEDNILKWVALSDGRFLNFRNGNTGDFVLTLRSFDVSLQRLYTALYSNRKLTGSKLQIGSNFFIDFDKDGNLIRAVFGEGSNAKQASYAEGEEFAVGVISHHELYSRTGRRLVHSNYSDKTSEPILQEYDVKQRLNFEVAHLDGENLSGLEITVDNITKHNVELKTASDNKLIKITTISSVLGEIMSYRKEEGVTDANTSKLKWKVITTDWQKLMKVPGSETIEKFLTEKKTDLPGKKVSAPALAPDNKTGSASDFLEHGLELKKKGEYDKVITNYSRAIEMEPKGDIANRAYYNRANCWLAKKDYDKAIVDYTKAIEIKRNALTYNNRGIAWKKKGDFEKAMADFYEAIKINPSNSDSYDSLGSLFLDKGEYEKALEAYSTSVKIKPDNAYAFSQRGYAWKKKEEYDRALADYSEAIRLDAKDSWSYAERAYIFIKQGENDKAIADCTKAIEIKSDYAYAYSKRGDAWLYKGTYDKAISDYSAALQFNSGNSYVWGQLGYTWKMKKDYDKAILNFTKQVEIEPKSDWGFWQRARCWQAKKEYDKAISDYSRAIEIAPKKVSYYCDRGVTWNYKREFDRELADYNKAIKINPQYAIAYNNRGAVWNEKGEYAKAITDYSRAIELDSKYVLAYQNRGNVLSKKGEIQRALDDYTKAIELDSREYKSYYKRALILEKMGRLQEALEDARKALKLWPDNNYYRNLVSNLEAKIKAKGVVSS